MIKVEVRLGTLAVESVQAEKGNFEYGAGVAPVNYRPVATPVLNDGKWHYWMSPNHETYRINHDGTGWRVTCSDWGVTSHIFRLATPENAFAGSLPTDAGPIVLEVGASYEIRREGLYSPWGLYRAG